MQDITAKKFYQRQLLVDTDISGITDKRKKLISIEPFSLYNTNMTLEDHAEFSCSYCGRTNSLHVDYSAGPTQEFVTDCENCCRPMNIRLQISEHGVDSIEALREDE